MGPVANTDRELYREDTGDPAGPYYENSVHVTESGSIGMNVGGHVVVMPIADWMAAAYKAMPHRPRQVLGTDQLAPRGDCVTADEVTGIDEIVLTRVDVHIEAMSDKSYTLIFTRPGGFHLQADLWAKRKPLTMRLLEAENTDGVNIEGGVFKE